MPETSTIPIFSRLADVPPREAWAHEAHAFTPWLADNLDRLSEAIGVPLELSGREVGVGRYSADLLATTPDGAAVLIENQLEASDHRHLGQIMTYLAGLEAQVVVWLAPYFNEEHLSALRWLNGHTDERFSFFAVRLRVVRIADSPLAPLFEVLEKPNSWDRSLQKTARAAADASGATRQAFWEAYAEVDPAVLEDRRTGRGGTNRWRAVPGTGLVINRYKARDHVALFIRGTGDIGDDELIDVMTPHLAAFERELRAQPGEWSNFWIKGPAVSDDPNTWPPAITWLREQTDRYVAAVASRFSKDHP